MWQLYNSEYNVLPPALISSTKIKPVPQYKTFRL